MAVFHAPPQIPRIL